MIGFFSYLAHSRPMTFLFDDPLHVPLKSALLLMHLHAHMIRLSHKLIDLLSQPYYTFCNTKQIIIFFSRGVLRYFTQTWRNNSFGVFSDAFPGLKMWVTFACATANFLTHFIISIAVLENVPPDAGLQKNATFPH
jgi:hypothetical protein